SQLVLQLGGPLEQEVQKAAVVREVHVGELEVLQRAGDLCGDGRLAERGLSGRRDLEGACEVGKLRGFGAGVQREGDRLGEARLALEVGIEERAFMARRADLDGDVFERAIGLTL